MKFLKQIPYILLVVAFGYIMFLRECTHCPECEPCDTIVEHHYHTDTVNSVDTAYVPRIVNHYHTDTLIDTIEVYNDYFTINYYHDTILDDTNGFITISDSVTQNRIVYRRPVVRIFPHIITETTTIRLKPELRNKVFMGLGVGRSVEEFGLSANVGLMTKRDNLYTISYDVLNKDIYLSMYWKLSFRKR